MAALSDALLDKAKKELKENRSTRSHDLQKFRERVLAQRGLECPTDDAFLLRFMRARKFDLDRALALLKRYYEVRNEYLDMFSDFKPSTVKQVYDDQVVTRLPGTDPNGSAIIYVRPGKWNTEKYAIMDVMKANVLQLDKTLQEEAVQINGVIVIVNLKEVGWQHLKNMNPFVAKRFTSVLQDALPCRLKGIHYVNVPQIFDTVFSLIRQFLKKKVQERVKISAQPDYLLDLLGADVLPDDLGGKLDVKRSAEDWSKFMLSCDDEFEALKRFKIVPVEPPPPMAQTDVSDSGEVAVSSVVGSFRKLSTD